MTTYTSDIVLGDEYLDAQSGFKGIATACYFFQYGCERVELQAFDKKAQNINSLTFDAPRLTATKTGKVAKVHRTGGPQDVAPRVEGGRGNPQFGGIR